MDYRVDPGLYALGCPTAASHVFVTANYKMSFDIVRRALAGYDAWLLVLDTDGINVWCAAGKGTFGTDELERRITASGLASLVSHRTLILPQLGAPGVAAHEIRERTGFRVVYGPVKAADLPAFLSAGLKATPAMRNKTFTAVERLVLAPVELVGALKFAAPAACLFVFLLFLGSAFSWTGAVGSSAAGVAALGVSILAGAIVAPLMLPWLPGRAFSLKGLVTGLVLALATVLAFAGRGGLSAAQHVALLLAIPAMSAYLTMNFTGASTFTSLSGVRREMRWALPLEIAGCAAGLLLLIAASFSGGPTP
jgi:acetyl-CoA decarbonylase/synthase complex subunit gamma